MADSPRATAQKVVNNRSLSYSPIADGSWAQDATHQVVVLRPPSKAFIFALHQPTLKFFRSASRGSSRLTPTTLRTVIAQDRLWLQDRFKNDVPGGLLLLALERGDTEAVDRAAAMFPPPAPPAPPAPVPSPATPKPSQSPSRPRSSGRRTGMSLIDVRSSTKRIIMAETTHTLDVDRLQLIGVLRQAGAELPRSATIRFLTGDGTAIEFNDAGKIRITWSEVKETEETV